MVRQLLVTCELCGDEVDAATIEKHNVVPREVMEQARMRRARVVRLCPKCGVEIRNWYKAKVDKNIYDAQIQRFRARLPIELVKEYENAFNRFARYKNNQKQLI